MDIVQNLADALKQAKYAVILTGAGASTESGLPDFRSKEGLWRGVDPMKLTSMTALRQNPVEFFQFYRQRLSKLWDAHPNRVHEGIAKLETAGYVKTIITQNIDGLHQAAGARNVVEVHGSLRECVCTGCRRRYSSERLDVDVSTEADVPRCDVCDGVLKPGVVLFEEALPQDAMQHALEASQRSDLFVVIGSSLQVGPVNQLPGIALSSGADLAIINLQPTYIDGAARWVIREQAGSVVTQLTEYLER